MKIAVACDHGALTLKEYVLRFFESRNITAQDLGAVGTESVDYPDYAEKLALLVSRGEVDAGVLLCGTGIGMCITANKFPKVRAAVVSDPYSARMAKEHNNANILCLGGRVIDSEEKTIALLSAWFDATYVGDRHARRLEKIRDIERKNFKS